VFDHQVDSKLRAAVEGPGAQRAVFIFHGL